MLKAFEYEQILCEINEKRGSLTVSDRGRVAFADFNHGELS